MHLLGLEQNSTVIQSWPYSQATQGLNWPHASCGSGESCSPLYGNFFIHKMELVIVPAL
jgi:hypothetical protein